ncbi:hypothetical protein GCM10011314_21240 [Knoellia flava]|uniref:Uncharacterized protein n=1 Tax=Knoellia flava TaxID=913969 RepID=A0A8H9FSV2_9MICO|nr:hypothetical protein GCM10011314_21240 [Knoellia flava]
MGTGGEPVDGVSSGETPPETGRCNVETVAQDLGDESAERGDARPTVVACDGAWAIFQTGYLPQSWLMAKWTGSAWEAAFGFPTANCRDDFIGMGGSPKIAAVPNWSC